MLAIGMPGPFEMLFIVVVALLIFGRRLPDIARSAGKSIVEFKKGLNDVKDEIDRNADDRGRNRNLPAQKGRTLPESADEGEEPARSRADARVGSESSD